LPHPWQQPKRLRRSTQGFKVFLQKSRSLCRRSCCYGSPREQHVLSWAFEAKHSTSLHLQLGLGSPSNVPLAICLLCNLTLIAESSKRRSNPIQRCFSFPNGYHVDPPSCGTDLCQIFSLHIQLAPLLTARGELTSCV
jgi:hypothetical protein